MPELGTRIRELRLAKGLSQAQLGQGKYSGSYISHIESGRRIPTADVLAFIAARLDLPVSQLDPNDEEAGDAEIAGLLASCRREFEAGLYDEAMRSATEARAVAGRLNRACRAWEAEILQARIYTATGRYQLAAKLADRLASADCVAAVPKLRAEAHIVAAFAYRSAQDYNEAATQAHAAIQLVDEVPIALEASALIELLAALVASQEDIDTELIEDRLIMLTDELDALNASQVLRALASVRIVRGDARVAIEYLEHAVGLCDPRLDAKTWASLKLAIARLIVDDPELPDSAAAAQLQAAAPIVELCCRTDELAGLRLIQARLAMRQGDYRQAGQTLEQLVHQAQLTADLIFEAEVAKSYADTLIALKDDQAAREWLKRSAALFEQADAHQRALEIWHRFAAM